MKRPPAELSLGHTSNLDALCPEHPGEISSNPTCLYGISEAGLARNLTLSRALTGF